MKELKIGEDIRIRCVEDTKIDGCSQCIFCGWINCDIQCLAEGRTDGKNVHFELVEE